MLCAMKTTMRVSGASWLAAWMILTGLLPAQAETLITNASSAQTPIPYVPTRHDTARDLLWMADVGTNDVVYDLGSGDGRVVIAAIRDFGARRAVGIEINPQLVQESREKAAQAGVANRVQFIQGDLFTNDFSQASVVVLYLGHGANLDLRAKLVSTLKPGSRVVSHQFGMGEWPTDKVLDVRTPYFGMYGEMFNEFKTNPDVPDFDSMGSRRDHDVLSEWLIPAPVAGVWRGKVRSASGEGELTLTLHQRLSEVTGSFQFQGQTNLEGYVKADLWGDQVRYWCISTNRNFYFSQIWFEGHAIGDTLSGSLWMAQGKETRAIKWVGHRDKTDFTGTWEWAGRSNSPVQLRIERRDGRLTATYTDKNRALPMYEDDSQPIPITDIYDFGIGFYFTLLLGREGNSRRMGPDDGWLIGEAVAQDNILHGTIAFYPYHSMSGLRNVNQPAQPDNKPNPQEGRHDWEARLITP